ncbi:MULTISPECIES: peptidoglycan-binding domain-containing protein [unclassified Ruegeria]|uniref:peptidoglycan-binding domain-containing protein n=1 Tax=unclassified Ruegeria TaxID=2625375 RepID=UPI001488E31E|nr:MULTISPECIES: peptidoglycan-binding domain-containing protein [unclassified Ruegeria]
MKNLLFVVFVLFGVPALSEETVEQILEEAKVAYQNAGEAEPQDQLPNYQKTKELLEQIIAKYPSSDAAVQILLEEPTAGIDVAALNRYLADPIAGLPPNSNPKEESMVPSEKTDLTPLLPATEGEEAAMNLAIQDYRDIQARLTVLGFDPNGVDGKPGKGTRSAISRWQSEHAINNTGYLNDAQLNLLKQDSEELLVIWLQNKENARLYEPPPPIALGPANLSGNWRYTTTCGRNSRIGQVKISGVFAIAHKGGSSYSGRINNSQGFRGTINGGISNRRFDAEVNWGLFLGRVQVTGYIADYELAMSGRDSNGCSVYARKS